MKLLVIDIQKGITNERLYNFENFIKNTVRLINAARQNKVEVIYVQHDDGEGSGFSVGNEMMWPKRFAKCISVDNAVEMLRKHAL